MKALTTLLVVGMFLMPAALADDVDDVKAALARYFNMVNTGNASGWAQYFLPDSTVFGEEGQLLNQSTPQQRQSGLQGNLDAGTKYNLGLNHVDVKIYGNTAVITGYRAGTIANPDGTVEQGPWRYSATWFKQGGQWKQAHRHVSSLRGTGE